MNKGKLGTIKENAVVKHFNTIAEINPAEPCTEKRHLLDNLNVRGNRDTVNVNV